MPLETVISRVLFPCAIQDSDHSSGTSIARHLKRPTRELQAGCSQALPYLVLLRMGFTKPATSPPQLVSSYLTFSPLPGSKRPGGIFSVALSLGSPPVRVTDHPALWSPDFPPDKNIARRSSAISAGKNSLTLFLKHISDAGKKDKLRSFHL